MLSFNCGVCTPAVALLLLYSNHGMCCCSLCFLLFFFVLSFFLRKTRAESCSVLVPQCTTPAVNTLLRWDIPDTVLLQPSRTISMLLPPSSTARARARHQLAGLTGTTHELAGLTHEPASASTESEKNSPTNWPDWLAYRATDPLPSL